MALKHVKRYYAKVEQQYFEMLQELKDFEKEVQEGFVEESILESARKILIPLKQNYDRLSYIMVLMNQPRRESNKAKYKNKNKNVYKYLELNKSLDTDVIEENTEVLSNLKQFVENLKDSR